MKSKLKKSVSLLLVALLLLSSMAFSAVALESAGTGATVEQVTGNILTDGSFENGVSGWQTEGEVTLERVIADTYENSAGAAYVEQGTSAKVYQQVSIRKYSWYKYSVAVKLASGTEAKEAVLTLDYLADAHNTAATITQEAVTVTADDWTTVSGYFLRKNETALAAPVADDATYYYQAAQVYLQIGEGEAVNYYMDDFSICRLEGLVNSDFAEGTFGWDEYKASKSAMTITDGDANIPEEAGKKKAVVIHTGNDQILMGQPMSFDQGVTYDITAKVKVTPNAEREDVTTTYTTIRFYQDSYNMNTNTKGTYINLGVPIVNNEWQSIKGTFTYTGEDPILNVYLTLYFNPDKGNMTYEFMDFEIKKQSNLVTNPYFSTVTFNGVDTATTKNSDETGWNSADYTTIDLFEGHKSEAFDTIGTYDNSFSRANIPMVAENWAYNSPSQWIVMEEGRKYNISVWLNRDDTTGTQNTDASVRWRFDHYSNTSGQHKTGIQPDSYGTIQLGWNKRELTYQASDLPVDYYRTQIILRSNVAATVAENMYFDDLSVEPIYEAPVVTAVDAGTIIAQATLPAATITAAASPDAYSYRYRYLLYDDASDATGTPALTGHTAVDGSIPSATVPGSWGGKYVSLEITPVSECGLWGETVTSTKAYVANAYEITRSISGTIAAGETVSANVTVTNNLTADLPVMVIIAYFLENGELSMTAIEEATVVNGTPVTLDPSLTLPVGTSGGTVKVFTWKGYDGTKLLMQPLIGVVQKP